MSATDQGVVSMPAFAPLYGMGSETVSLRWLTVEYRTRPDVLESLLPEPLLPTEDPLVAAWVAEFIGARFHLPDGGVERRPPYMQAGICVRCRRGDQVGAYPLIFFIEGLNHGILGREIFGLPKKQAKSVTLNTDENGVSGSIVTANDIEVVTLRGIRPDRDADEIDPIPGWFGNHFTLKLIPSADGRGYDVNHLVRVPFTTSAQRGGWVAQADISLTYSAADPLHLVECKEVVGARYGEVDLAVGFGTYLDRVDRIPTFGAPQW